MERGKTYYAVGLLDGGGIDVDGPHYECTWAMMAKDRMKLGGHRKVALTVARSRAEAEQSARDHWGVQ